MALAIGSEFNGSEEARIIHISRFRIGFTLDNPGLL
jgi:hypothetical protein